ncbi:ribosome small subunit-dependent GTPase A [Fusibacter bizertensis]
MSHGIIFKGIGGFYYVKQNGILYECKARGKFKNDKIIPMVGDYVTISVHDTENKLGMIEEIHERRNSLIRPVVANVDQAVVVFSIKDPMPNMTLLDKMIVLAEHSALDVVVCFNKSDLDLNFDFETYREIYEAAGYKVLKTCALTLDGIDELIEALAGKINVFSGPSGAGKSSLLNAIADYAVETGELSSKIKRGKHTTRHSELFEIINGGIIVDTPGFTSLSVSEVDPEDLPDYFPEFKKYAESCRFDNCLHQNEPGCQVKAAMTEGKINKQRYDAYIYIFNEIVEQRRRLNKW